MGKEKFKTILLMTLFVLSIALTKQLWISVPIPHDMSFANQMKNMDSKVENHTKDIFDIFSPQSFTVNFGGGLHTVFYDDVYNIWAEVLSILQNSSSKKDVIIEEIEVQRWMEENKARSIKMDFGFSMPVDALGSVFKGKEIEVLDEKVSSVDSILVSLIDEDSIYIADCNEGKYYRIKGKGEKKNLFNIMNTIEAESHSPYYAIKDIYGVENNNLMPLELDNNIPKIRVVQEIDPTNNTQVEAFAGTFFGENFDFVRKMVESNGSVIYMYGYGQKSLKIDASGMLEYIEQMDEEKSRNSVTFDHALKIALKFVGDHGSWSSVEAYLKQANAMEKGKKKGYQFVFGYRLNRFPIYYSDEIGSEAIEVHVMGEQITYYKRLLKKEKIAMNFLENNEDTLILSTPEVIDQNFDMIMEDYIKDMNIAIQGTMMEEILKEVLSSIETVEIGYYYKPMKEPDKLIPVWIIKLDKRIYYFDVYTGTLMYRGEI
ncbi:two-component system activity regulator YycH [Clostridiaceae bacterium 35-E11]